MEYERRQQYNSSDRTQRRKAPDPQPDAAGSPMLKQGGLGINLANLSAYSSTRGSTLEQSSQSGGADRDIPDSTDSTTLVAQAQAGLVAFGPVGVAVAVGITGITISIWLNSPDGRKFLGEITDVVSRGIDGTLNELQRILDQGGELVREQYQSIEEYIRRNVFFSQRGRQGDAGDTGIRREAEELIAQNMEDALNQLMREARQANNGKGDKKRMQRIKKEQKEQRIRRSRQGENR
jgi:hypothetical protein